MALDLPKTFDFGSGELVEISHLCTTFGIHRRTAFLYLEALHIKPVYFGDEVFFSLPTFNRVMYVLTRPGAPGFVFPGSKGKNRKYVRDSGALIEITDELLREAMRPETLVEMGACKGNSTLIGKLASYRDKSKRKRKKNE